MLGLIMLVPGLAFAASENGQGSTSGNTGTSSTSVDSSAASSNTTDATQSQTQTNNPSAGTMTQTRTETQIQEDISQATSQYTPKNSKGVEQRSAVASAAQQLIRTAAQVKNEGIGDQIRTIAQTQTKNQDKIGQSIDKAETRSGFAKFFIGANYKELKIAKDTLSENQKQIKSLEQILTQLTSNTDKITVANQIIVLQQTQLELKDQLTSLQSGFSLFGWMNRWKNNF